MYAFSLNILPFLNVEFCSTKYIHIVMKLKPCKSDGTWTHSLLIETTHLVSVPNKAQVPDVSLQKEFSEKQRDG